MVIGLIVRVRFSSINNGTMIRTVIGRMKENKCLRNGFIQFSL
jgi:hypothetical protein